MFIFAKKSKTGLNEGPQLSLLAGNHVGGNQLRLLSLEVLDRDLTLGDWPLHLVCELWILH